MKIEVVTPGYDPIFRIRQSSVQFSVDKRWHEPEGWIVQHAYANEPQDIEITLTDDERDEVEAWLTANIIPEYPL